MRVNFFNQGEGCVNKPICFLQIDEFAGAALGTGFAKDDYNHQLSRGRPVCCICTESAAKFPGLAALPRLKPRLSAAIPRRPFCAWPFLQRDLQRVAAVGSLFICTLPFPIRLSARSGGIPTPPPSPRIRSIRLWQNYRRCFSNAYQARSSQREALAARTGSGVKSGGSFVRKAKS